VIEGILSRTNDTLLAEVNNPKYEKKTKKTHTHTLTHTHPFPKPSYASTEECKKSTTG